MPNPSHNASDTRKGHAPCEPLAWLYEIPGAGVRWLYRTQYTAPQAIAEGWVETRLYAAPPTDDGVTCIAQLCPPGPNDPQDCDWPFCGCDPVANKVLTAVEESRRLAAAFQRLPQRFQHGRRCGRRWKAA